MQMPSLFQFSSIHFFPYCIKQHKENIQYRQYSTKKQECILVDSILFTSMLSLLINL